MHNETFNSAGIYYLIFEIILADNLLWSTM